MFLFKKKVNQSNINSPLSLQCDLQSVITMASWYYWKPWIGSVWEQNHCEGPGTCSHPQTCDFKLLSHTAWRMNLPWSWGRVWQCKNCMASLTPLSYNPQFHCMYLGFVQLHTVFRMVYMPMPRHLGWYGARASMFMEPDFEWSPSFTYRASQSTILTFNLVHWTDHPLLHNLVFRPHEELQQGVGGFEEKPIPCSSSSASTNVLIQLWHRGSLQGTSCVVISSTTVVITGASTTVMASEQLIGSGSYPSSCMGYYCQFLLSTVSINQPRYPFMYRTFLMWALSFSRSLGPHTTFLTLCNRRQLWTSFEDQSERLNCYPIYQV